MMMMTFMRAWGRSSALFFVEANSFAGEHPFEEYEQNKEEGKKKQKERSLTTTDHPAGIVSILYVHTRAHARCREGDGHFEISPWENNGKKMVRGLPNVSAPERADAALIRNLGLWAWKHAPKAQRLVSGARDNRLAVGRDCEV